MVTIEIRQTSSVAPVQYEGKVDWYKLYFRARHDRWYSMIWSMDGMYVRGAPYGQPGSETAGAMDDLVAQDFIERCLAEYLDGVRGEFDGEPPPLPPAPPAPLPLAWDQETRTARGHAPGDVNEIFFEKRYGADSPRFALKADNELRHDTTHDE